MKAGRIEHIIISGLLIITVVSAMVLTLPQVEAVDNGVVDSIAITVRSSCSMSSTVEGEHAVLTTNEETTELGGTTLFNTVCNDGSGYAIYATGFTDDEYGKTVLTDATLGSEYDIRTSNLVDTADSAWAVKLTPSGTSYVPIIVGSLEDSLKESTTPDFSVYQAVPSEYTKVAYYASTTDTGDAALGSNIAVNYRVYISKTQPAGIYVGQVKYTLVHPSTEVAPMP